MVIQFFLQLIITTFRMFCADLKFLKDTLGHKVIIKNKNNKEETRIGFTNC